MTKTAKARARCVALYTIYRLERGFASGELVCLGPRPVELSPQARAEARIITALGFKPTDEEFAEVLSLLKIDVKPIGSDE